MLLNEITSKEWLEIIGKDRLQTFQDAFAKLHGISCVFFDQQGYNLTTCSNRPLFCQAASEKNVQRCKEEEMRSLALVQEEQSMKVFTCYLGLKYFIVPVFFNGKIVAYICGGIVADKATAISGKNREKFNVIAMSEEKLRSIAYTLNLEISLLNIDIDNMFKTVYGGNKPIESVFEGKLSKREIEVSQAICEGLNNKQIAERLFISEKTVKSHLSNIFLKLDLQDRVQLIVEYGRYMGKRNGDLGEHTKTN